MSPLNHGNSPSETEIVDVFGLPAGPIDLKVDGCLGGPAESSKKGAPLIMISSLKNTSI